MLLLLEIGMPASWLAIVKKRRRSGEDRSSRNRTASIGTIAAIKGCGTNRWRSGGSSRMVTEVNALQSKQRGAQPDLRPDCTSSSKAGCIRASFNCAACGRALRERGKTG